MSMLGHPCEVVHELVLCAHGEKRSAAEGLTGQALCPWSNHTKQRVLVQGKGKSAPPTQLGTSSRWLRSVNSIYSCFCLSHFCFYWSDIHTHTYMLFLTSKNKLVGFFFSYWLHTMVKWLHILTRFCLQTCWNICVRVVYWDPSVCCTSWCSGALLTMVLRMLGSISCPKHNSMYKALLTASLEQLSLMLTKAGSSFSSLQPADSFTNVFQQMCKLL